MVHHALSSSKPLYRYSKQLPPREARREDTQLLSKVGTPIAFENQPYNPEHGYRFNVRGPSVHPLPKPASRRLWLCLLRDGQGHTPVHA